MGNDKYAKIVFLWSCRKSKMWGKRFLLTIREGLKWDGWNHRLLESQPVPIIHRERVDARRFIAAVIERGRLKTI